MIFKKKILYLCPLCLILFLSFPVSSRAVSEKFSPLIESFPDGKIDWDNGDFYGVGVGYPHLNDGSKARALRVAQASALSAILKVASRIRVNDQHTLSGLERKRVIIQIRGLIHYESYGREFIEEGDHPFYRVTYRAPMKGVEGLTKRLLTHLRSQPMKWQDFPRQEQGLDDRDESYPWLVLDARGLQQQGPVQPAIFPKILTEKGETVYDLTRLEESALVKRGVARYVVSDRDQEELMTMSGRRSFSSLRGLFSPQVARAEERRKRKRRGRYIIKNVKRAEGLMRANLVISESDARGIRAEDASSQILKKCSVIIIVSSAIGGIEGRVSPCIALGR